MPERLAGMVLGVRERTRQPQDTTIRVVPPSVLWPRRTRWTTVDSLDGTRDDFFLSHKDEEGEHLTTNGKRSRYTEDSALASHGCLSCQVASSGSAATRSACEPRRSCEGGTRSAWRARTLDHDGHRNDACHAGAMARLPRGVSPSPARPLVCVRGKCRRRFCSGDTTGSPGCRVSVVAVGTNAVRGPTERRVGHGIPTRGTRRDGSRRLQSKRGNDAGLSR